MCMYTYIIIYNHLNTPMTQLRGFAPLSSWTCQGQIKGLVPFRIQAAWNDLKAGNKASAPYFRSDWCCDCHSELTRKQQFGEFFIVIVIVIGFCDCHGGEFRRTMAFHYLIMNNIYGNSRNDKMEVLYHIRVICWRYIH